MDRCRRRLDRAWGHICDLKAEIGSYVEDGAGHKYHLIQERDPEFGGYRVRLQVWEPPDLELWSLIISDSVHQFWRTNILMRTSDRVVAVLDQLQPYLGPDGADAHPLYILSILSNDDKHRSPAVTIAKLVLTIGTISVDRPNRSFRFDLTREPFQDNATIARFTISPDDAARDLKASIPFQVRLDKKGPAASRDIGQLLTYLHDFIRDEVFPKFDEFL